MCVCVLYRDNCSGHGTAYGTRVRSGGTGSQGRGGGPVRCGGVGGTHSPRGVAVKRQTGPPSRAAAARLLCTPSNVCSGGDVEPAGRFAISTSPVRRKRTGRRRRRAAEVISSCRYRALHSPCVYPCARVYIINAYEYNTCAHVI